MNTWPSRRSVTAGIASVAFAPAMPAAATLRTSETYAIDHAAAKALSNGAAPGLQIAVMRRGRLLLGNGYGLENIARARPVTTRSIFRIGSLTKQFVAACLFRLEELGSLSLGSPADRYLPVLRGKAPFTLLEAIHHTAGLHSDEDEASAPAAASISSQQQLVDAIVAQPKMFDFEPGTAWQYSNANYVVLGAVIEAVTGQSLGQALRALLFKPCGLPFTAVDHGEDIIAHRVTGYSRAADSEPAVWAEAPAIDIIQAGGAGAMRSTASDLCRWHFMLLSGRVLRASSLARLLEPGRLRNGQLSGTNRYSSEDSHYGDMQYAGGLLVSPTNKRPRIVTHYGFINGFSAVLETDLDRLLTLAACLNSDPGPDLPFHDLRRAVFGVRPA